MKTNLIGISGKIGSGKDTVGKILQYLAAKKYWSDAWQMSYEDFSKDTLVANRYDSKFKIKKYADKLKDIVCLLIGCTREQLEDREFKEKELGEEWNIWVLIPNSDHNLFDGNCQLQEGIFSSSDEAKKYIKKHKIINVLDIEERALTPRKLLQLLGTECGRQIIHPNIWVNALFADYKERVLTHEEEKRLLSIWKNINTRCNNPNYEKYNLYGGKGITNSWKTFDSFKGWAKSNGYTNDLTIDRVDRDLGYNPNNCRWVTPSLQAFNQGVYKNSKSGIRGVSIKSSRKDRNWVAQIQYKGKKDHLGYFKTKEEAEKVYLSKQSEIEKLLVSESEKALYKNDNNKWIITDVRFENEAKAIKDRGGIVIRVDRLDLDKFTTNFPQTLHPSETALDDYEFDAVLNNEGSIEELIEKVKQLNLV